MYSGGRAMDPGGSRGSSSTETGRRRDGRDLLREFLDVPGEELAQPTKAWVFLQVRPRIAQRARHVLDIDGITPRHRLIAECAERLQVALQRHQIEAAAEFFAVGVPLQREEVRDQLVELAVRDVDVRVAQQRREIVGV